MSTAGLQFASSVLMQTNKSPPNQDWPQCSFCCETRNSTGRHIGSAFINVPHSLIRKQSHKMLQQWSDICCFKLLPSSLPISFMCATKQNVPHTLPTYSEAGCIRDRLSTAHKTDTVYTHSCTHPALNAMQTNL